MGEHRMARSSRRRFLQWAALAAAGAARWPARRAAAAGGKPKRPNILFAIADDWSQAHAGAYGDQFVRTPTFDRLAREGVLFTSAYCASPSCTPSRASILTGQMFWRLKSAANLFGTLPDEFDVYPKLLQAAGYHVGHQGKGYGPGKAGAGGGAGPGYRRFGDFLERRPAGRPFCFWFGSFDPHRPYGAPAALDAGRRREDITVPPYLPDVPEVRDDILAYYAEVERFDRDVGEALEQLQAAGELDNTLVVMTSDNGWPFPRAKTNLYDAGVRMPLAVRGPGVASPGRRVDDFIAFHDFAPTLLLAAGLTPPESMTGRSFLDLLTGGKAGRVDPRRDKVFFGRERHVAPAYPMRAIRTHEFLYIRNFQPDGWPVGQPGGERWNGRATRGGCADIDGSPTKAYMADHRADEAVRPLCELAWGRRPGEELYDVRKDPHQLINVAERPDCAAARKRLAGELGRYLAETADPRR